jgi:hypothetical protein
MSEIKLLHWLKYDKTVVFLRYIYTYICIYIYISNIWVNVGILRKWT